MNRDHYDDFLKLETETFIVDEKDSYYAFENTPFWGEKGGMPSDKGYINGKKLIDLKWDGDKLYHKVEGELENPIICKVDFETRLINTAVQSALHLMDGFYNRKGHYIPAIGTNWNNLWYELDHRVTEEELEEAQKYINKAIIDDVKLNIEYIKGENYPDDSYKKFDHVRIVDYPGLDRQPCGTPHLKSTSQIQSFVILGKEKSSRGDRIHFTCSLLTDKLLKDFYNGINQMSHSINCKKEEVIERVDRLLEESKETKKLMKEMKSRLSELEAINIKNNPNKVILVENMDGGDLRNIANKLGLSAEEDKILISSVNGKTNILIASGGDRARNIFEAIKDDGQVRGGGSPKIVSGNSALSMEKLNEVVESIM